MVLEKPMFYFKRLYIPMQTTLTCVTPVGHIQLKVPGVVYDCEPAFNSTELNDDGDGQRVSQRVSG